MVFTSKECPNSGHYWPRHKKPKKKCGYNQTMQRLYIRERVRASPDSYVKKQRFIPVGWRCLKCGLMLFEKKPAAE